MKHCALPALALGLLARALVPARAGSVCDEAAESVRASFVDRDSAGNVRLDAANAVPPKSDVLAAWQKRQNAITSFRFAWTEVQCRPKGWIPNPRYPQREWLAIPTLLVDRAYTVTKTLEVDGGRMRYGFEMDRAEEPDGVGFPRSGGSSR